MRKGKQKNRGITLIALVVTIVVLLILAGITIGTLTGDNGIIKGANSAKESTEKATLEEQVEAAIIIARQKHTSPTLDQVIEEIKKIDGIDNIDIYTGNIQSTSGYVISGKLEDYIMPKITMSEAQKKEKFEEKTQIEDISGNKFIIPKGFRIATDSEDTIAKGIVIEDGKNNQFVWVPVDDMKNFIRTAGYANSSLQPYNLEEYTEPFLNGYKQEAAEKSAMKQSVQNNKGFYIGRYEAGKDSNENVVVQKGASVYSKVSWGNSMSDITQGAVKLSKEFASNNGYQGVTSTLCYGVQWDATLRFIDPEFTGFAKNSSKQGWHNDNYNKTDSGNTTTNPNHITGEDLIYSVNSNVVANKQNNIYDMAGNVWEWTMEAYLTNSRVMRGGNFYASGNSSPSSRRNNSYSPNTDNYGDVGFRITLYL